MGNTEEARVLDVKIGGLCLLLVEFGLTTDVPYERCGDQHQLIGMFRSVKRIVTIGSTLFNLQVFVVSRRASGIGATDDVGEDSGVLVLDVAGG